MQPRLGLHSLNPLTDAVVLTASCNALTALARNGVQKRDSEQASRLLLRLLKREDAEVAAAAADALASLTSCDTVRPASKSPSVPSDRIGPTQPMLCLRGVHPNPPAGSVQIGDYEVYVKQLSSSVQVGMAWKVMELLLRLPCRRAHVGLLCLRRVEQVWTSSILLARYLDAEGRVTISDRCSAH